MISRIFITFFALPSLRKAALEAKQLNISEHMMHIADDFDDYW